MKILYIFRDPLGSEESKIGITGHVEVRLGTYQNSYSKTSHTACFDVVYVGPPKAIERLENAVKQTFNWQIERDGRGSSEWINENCINIELKIDELIEGYKFKIKKIPKKFLPLTVDNFQKIKDIFFTPLTIDK